MVREIGSWTLRLSTALPIRRRRVVAVLAAYQVNLRHRVETDRGQGVDEQPELHAVAGWKRQPLEQRATRGVLAAEGLDEAGELRPVHVDERSSDELRDATTAGGGNG